MWSKFNMACALVLMGIIGIDASTLIKTTRPLATHAKPETSTPEIEQIRLEQMLENRKPTPECRSLSWVAWRCGPAYGRCNEDFNWGSKGVALYCDLDTGNTFTGDGWCGNTEAYMNAQSGDEYDWDSSSCQEPVNECPDVWSNTKCVRMKQRGKCQEQMRGSKTKIEKKCKTTCSQCAALDENCNCKEKCSKSVADGTPGDGDGTQGSCDSGKYCYEDSFCSEKCSKSATGGKAGDGDGKTKGNCEGGTATDLCHGDGSCRDAT